jgi:hypothetical protein
MALLYVLRADYIFESRSCLEPSFSSRSKGKNGLTAVDSLIILKNFLVDASEIAPSLRCCRELEIRIGIYTVKSDS